MRRDRGIEWSSSRFAVKTRTLCVSQDSTYPQEIPESVRLLGRRSRMGPLKRARFEQLFFVFAVFGQADGQRAVRVVSACNTRASNGQRAIRAASACNTRASIRPSVFGGVHAFPC